MPIAPSALSTNTHPCPSTSVSPLFKRPSVTFSNWRICPRRALVCRGPDDRRGCGHCALDCHILSPLL
eukprot:9122187-Pyramimonas_sp.AAC.1